MMRAYMPHEENAPQGRYSHRVFLPKLRSAWIRTMRQNHRIIKFDACHAGISLQDDPSARHETLTCCTNLCELNPSCVGFYRSPRDHRKLSCGTPPVT